MDQPPEKDLVENQAEADDTADMDSRMSQADDYQAGEGASQQPTDQGTSSNLQSDQGAVQASENMAQQSAPGEQGAAQPMAAGDPGVTKSTPTAESGEVKPPEQPTKPAPEPPEGSQPASAYGEKGNADRAETGPEKPEVKNFHPHGPESGY